MTHGLFVSIKRMTGFNHTYLLLVSDYSRVLSAQQDLLASIFNSSVIARKQCSSCCQAQHASYLQNFSRHEALHALFCKLGHELYCSYSTDQLKLDTRTRVSC